MEKIKNQIASFLHRLGVSPNFLTVLGLLFAFGTAGLIYRGQFFWAGAVLLVSGALDLLDGAVARAAGKAGNFGGVFDSSLDRYGDGIVLGMLVIHFAARGQNLYAVFALSALLGSFAISYVRARAECEVDACRIGFWERGERIVYLALGLLFNNAALAVGVLGIFTHATVARRLFLSKRLLTGTAAPAAPVGDPRARLLYRLQVLWWVLLMILVHPAG